jgi:hypothetical protein
MFSDYDDITVSSTEYDKLKLEIKTCRDSLKEANDWLISGEGVDLCYHIDDVKTKAIVRQLLDNIYNEPKQR